MGERSWMYLEAAGTVCATRPATYTSFQATYRSQPSEASRGSRLSSEARVPDFPTVDRLLRELVDQQVRANG
jgi:hypothetical protein